MNLTINRGVVDVDIAFSQYLLKFIIADAMLSVSTHNPKDNST
ncbi:replication protein RepA, partial [Yersinia pestis]